MIDFSACIVAAGSGTRSGQAVPKQFVPVAGKPLLRWSADVLASHPRCRELIIAINPTDHDEAAAALSGLNVIFVEGGATRTRSVHACIRQASQPYVLIHDAARPGIDHALLDRLLAALETHSGAAPALAVADALVQEQENSIVAVSRENLWRLQTPQAFHTSELRDAFSEAGHVDFCDEVSLARAAGLSVKLVRGTEENFKVTFPEDFARAEIMLGGPMAPPRWN